MDQETKQEFAGVKNELAGMNQEFAGVKSELKALTKALKGFAKQVGKRFEQVDQRFDNLTEWAINNFVTKYEFQEFREYVEENMFTKKDFLEHVGTLDEMYQGFKRMNQNNLLTGKQLCDMDDQLAGHEKRIRKLEKVA